MENKKIKDLRHSIGLKYNMTDETIKQLVDSPFEFTKKILNEIDFSKINSEEDFEKLKKVFYHKKLGRIYISKKSLKTILKKNDD